MGYSIEKYQIYDDGSRLEVKNHFGMFVAHLWKSIGVDTLYSWKYEAESFQSVMVWVNKTKKEPLPYKYFESGTYVLPHNNGFGNSTGKREIKTSL